jgi:hypothetical protein
MVTGQKGTQGHYTLIARECTPFSRSIGIQARRCRLMSRIAFAMASAVRITSPPVNLSPFRRGGVSPPWSGERVIWMGGAFVAIGARGVWAEGAVTPPLRSPVGVADGGRARVGSVEVVDEAGATA